MSSIPDPAVVDWVPIANLGTQVNPGAELAYAEFTANASITAAGGEGSAQAVVTAPVVAFDGVTPVVIEFSALGSNPDPGAAGRFLLFWLFQDGVSLGIIGSMVTPAASTMTTPVALRRRLVPSAGSHTYSIRCTVSAGTGVVNAGPGGVGQTAPAFIRITTVGPSIGGLQPPSYGTSLPTSPADGQEAVLVDSLTNPTYQWRFRYNAGSSSSYKWEFVGGVPWQIAGTLAAGYANTTYVGITPTFTLPRAGDYQWEVCSMLQPTGGTPLVWMTVAISIGTASDANAMVAAVANPSFTYGMRRGVALGVAASAVLQPYVKVSANGANFDYRTMAITPVRVS